MRTLILFFVILLCSSSVLSDESNHSEVGEHEIDSTEKTDTENNKIMDQWNEYKVRKR